MKRILNLEKCSVALIMALLSACGGGGSSDTSPPPVNTPAPSAPISKAQLRDAARLAQQATFGMPYEALEPMARAGLEQWLSEQFSAPVTLHGPAVYDIVNRRAAGEFDAFEDDIEYLVFARRLGWWHSTITAEDTLRQRVAFALSQIFVVSDNVDILEVYPGALTTYYDNLLLNAFGNFEDLLRDVALSPAMGVYLSHLNNQKADTTRNTFPDENFAREVMQLFSIGLFELNPDGSERLDSNGQRIPTYDNRTIQEFAKVFTGLSYDGPSAAFGNNASPVFTQPMIMFDEAHETSEKVLLNGVVIPAGQTGLDDVDVAINNLFEHPNVGPFIGRQLIQRLVTSNPSAAYIQRVSSAFDDNGSGVRGDMRAVINAILTDVEARTRDALTTGKLQEPVVRYVSLLRQFGATSDDGFIAVLGYFLQSVGLQHPLSAPSVFNFYLPDHQPAGDLAASGLFAPELSITNSNSIISFPNFLDAILFGDFVTDAPQGFAPVQLTLDRWESLAADSDRLVDELNTLLSGGALGSESVAAIVTSVDAFEDLQLRTVLAIYYVSIAPETVIQR